MFILYAVATGVLLGILAGGRLERLGRVRLHWWPLAIAGLAVQLVLFSSFGAGVGGIAASALYVASTACVLAVVVRDLRLPGLPLVALGAALNLVAIVANGGQMPADPGALEAAGRVAGQGANSNGSVIAHPALQPLTDIFAIPSAMPLANVFSIGDVLIGIGLVFALVMLMRSAGEPASQTVVHPGDGGA
jgi:hypothetical protein